METSSIGEAALRLCKEAEKCERSCNGCRAIVREVLIAIKLDDPEKDYPGWIEATEGAAENEGGSLMKFWNAAIDEIIRYEREEYKALGMFTTSQDFGWYRQHKEEEHERYLERRRARARPAR